MNADFLCLSIFLFHFISMVKLWDINIELSKNASLRIFASYCLFNKIFVYVCVCAAYVECWNSPKMRTNYDGLYICVMIMTRGSLKSRRRIEREQEKQKNCTNIWIARIFTRTQNKVHSAYSLCVIRKSIGQSNYIGKERERKEKCVRMEIVYFICM